MNQLIIIVATLVGSVFCERDESSSLKNIPCINSIAVIEVRPDITYFRFVSDSGETLLDINSRITKYFDFADLLYELNSFLFPTRRPYRQDGIDSDYYIVNKQTWAGNEIRVVDKLDGIFFKTEVPYDLPTGANCAHIYGAKLIIDPLFDVTKPDGYNVTALFWSSYFGMTDLARSLVVRGADVNQIPEDFPWTPLSAAVLADQSELVDFLIKKGANVSEQVGGSEGLGALYLAANIGRTDISRILIEHGADVNQKSTMSQRTPLHIAAEHGVCDIVGLLTSKGANVSALTTNGKTPLHVATYLPKSDCINRLLDAGADINARDNDGDTPLTLALSIVDSEADALSIVKMFVEEHNSDVNIKNNDGVTALSIANDRRWTKVAKLLKARTAS